MSELKGQVISERYRVDAFLGKGGMAEVYKVWDRNRSVHLAMKILHEDLAEDKIFLRRFRREAQTLSKLQHPNIVRFYGLGQADDLVFMLMEYVEGTTLRKEIFKSSEPFSLERVAKIIRPVCAALHFAHHSGFIHCDIKPANIMIHNNGTSLIADFGIARMTEAATMTMVGAGTPAYMAPEQARGENPVLETDIYSLGVVLFEMLTGGERPFTGEHARTTGSTSEKIRWEQLNAKPPSPIEFNPNIHPALSALILKCLNKHPKDRYHGALELLEDFEQSISTRQETATFPLQGQDEIDGGEIIKEPVPGSNLPEEEPDKPEGIASRLITKLKSLQFSFPSLFAFFQPTLETASGDLSPVEKRKLFLSTFWRKNWVWGVASAVVIAGLLFGSVLFLTPTVSSIGTLYFTSDRNTNTEIYKLIGARAMRVTQTPGNANSWSPVLSNTGVLYFTSDRDGQAEIYKLVGAKAVRATQSPRNANSWSPVLSSTGVVYFTSDRDGQAEIYKLVGDKAVRVTQTPKNANSWSPVLSSTGVVYFTSDRDGQAEIYKLVGDKAVRVTQTPKNANSWSPVLSSTGVVYFTSDREGQAEIYKLVGEKAVRVTQTPKNANSWWTIGSGDGWNPSLYLLPDPHALTLFRIATIFTATNAVIIYA